MCYALGKGVSANHQTAFELLNKAAELNCPEAQYYLGRCYEHGNLTQSDYRKAKYWYEKSMNTFPLSHVALADLYFDGHGSKIHYYKANKMYKNAYDKGIKEAALGYGLTCLFIRGKEATGIEILKSIYDVNNYVINKFLGLCYEYSIGVSRDTERSKRYLKAAELAINGENSEGEV